MIILCCFLYFSPCGASCWGAHALAEQSEDATVDWIRGDTGLCTTSDVDGLGRAAGCAHHSALSRRYAQWPTVVVRGCFFVFCVPWLTTRTGYWHVIVQMLVGCTRPIRTSTMARTARGLVSASRGCRCAVANLVPIRIPDSVSLSSPAAASPLWLSRSFGHHHYRC